PGLTGLNRAPKKIIFLKDQMNRMDKMFAGRLVLDSEHSVHSVQNLVSSRAGGRRSLKVCTAFNRFKPHFTAKIEKFFAFANWYRCFPGHVGQGWLFCGQGCPRSGW